MTGLDRTHGLIAERAVIVGAIALTTAAAWAYVARLAGSGHMGHHMSAGAVPAVSMWIAMMTGMMLPSAAPMFVAYARVSGREPRAHWLRVIAFASAYLAMWIGVSVVCALAQRWLSAAGLVSHMGASTRPQLSAALLVGAGGYQFSSLKHACLRQCRTPLAFLLTEWRPGVPGALSLGLRHGRDCVFCCWAIMRLMFVLGTMNLLWMAALTVLMLVEKAAPAGALVGRVSGALFVLWGVSVLIGA
jgi:predicted metal-binding membrane protein